MHDDDGHTKNIVVWFQNLLWMYGIAWMRVRFPGLKFCSSPPLAAVLWATSLIPMDVHEMQREWSA